MRRALPSKLNYRVVNPQTGAEVIRNLFHLSGTWTILGMQKGSMGSSSLGMFQIELPPPKSKLARKYAAQLSLLDFGLRVEAYQGPVGAGQPVAAGIITGMPKTLGSWQITGYTDLFYASQSLAFPGEQIGLDTYDPSVSPITSNVLFSRYAGYNVAIFSEDVTSYSAANYTAVGTWTTATDDGRASITCSAGTDSSLVSKTASKGRPASFCLKGRVTSTSTDATNAGKVGIALYNGISYTYCFLTLKYNAGTTSYDVDVTFSSTTATSVLTNVVMPWRFELTVTGYGEPPGARSSSVNPSYVAVALNGKDAGISSTYTFGATNTSTQYGAYYSVPASGTAQAYVHEMLAEYPKSFTSGTVNTGAVAFQKQFNTAGQTYLDLMTVAATSEGWYWRYTPSRLTATQLSLGTVDFASAPGTDRSKSVRIVEGDNLIDVRIDPNADSMASKVRLNGTPDGDSGGFATAINSAAIAKYGLLEDLLPSIGTADWSALSKNSEAIVANKANVNVAKSVTVKGDSRMNGVREMDYVTIHAPSLGLVNYKALVIGYVLDETSPNIELMLDQYSAESMVASSRKNANQAYIAGFFKAR